MDNKTSVFRNLSGQCFIKKRGERFYQRLSLIAGLSLINYIVLKCHTVVYKIRVDVCSHRLTKTQEEGAFVHHLGPPVTYDIVLDTGSGPCLYVRQL